MVGKKEGGNRVEDLSNFKDLTEVINDSRSLYEGETIQGRFTEASFDPKNQLLAR